MAVAFSRLRLLIAALCLVVVGLWSRAVPFVGNARSMISGGAVDDAITLDEREYRSLVAALPSRGTIGYLAPAGWPDEPSVRAFHEAQYALTPRVLQLEALSEFVIVTPGVIVDDRLRPYVFFARSEHGQLQVFRKVN